MKPARGALQRLLSGLGISADVERVRAVDAWPGVARDTFGADSVDARAIGIDGTTLIVAVTTAAWASEIRLRERDLLGALARSAPGSGIEHIRTVTSTTRP